MIDSKVSTLSTADRDRDHYISYARDLYATDRLTLQEFEAAVERILSDELDSWWRNIGPWRGER